MTTKSAPPPAGGKVVYLEVERRKRRPESLIDRVRRGWKSSVHEISEGGK